VRVETVGVVIGQEDVLGRERGEVVGGVVDPREVVRIDHRRDRARKRRRELVPHA
jgi:hypothetical protein